MSLATNASTAVDGAVVNLINSGVTTVVAAGNDNTDANGTSPARLDVAITVGATTVADTKASYSNYGSVVDIWAPGAWRYLAVWKAISSVLQVLMSPLPGTTVKPTSSLELPWLPPTFLVLPLTCSAWTHL